MPGSSGSSDDECVEHHQFKLVLLGDKGVGKTAIVRRLVHSEFEPSQHTPTVGVEFYKAELSLADGVYTSLQVWDLASSVNSLDMAANYLHGCDAVLAVHDITQRETFAQICQWLDLLLEMFQNTGLPYVAVIANKADTPELAEAAAQLHAASTSTAQLYSYCVSAKTGAKVKSTFLSIAADLAGIPITQQLLDDVDNIESEEVNQGLSLQQQRQSNCKVAAPVTPSTTSVTYSGCLRLRKAAGCMLCPCSSPPQLVMGRIQEQQLETDNIRGVEELKICRCCFDCATCRLM